MAENHILIVDDEPKVAFFLSRALERSNRNYRVTIAGSGEEALEILGGSPVDVLVTDLRMPGISGLELIRWARASSPETRSILITAYGSEEIESQAYSLRASRYITKPFDIKQFTSAVQDALCLSDAESALAQEQHVRDILVSLIFHYLRVPLTHIMGNAAILCDRVAEQDKELCRSVVRNADHMRAAIEDFTLLTEWSVGHITGYRQRVRLRNFVETTIAELASLAASRHQDLILAPSGDSIDITTDTLALGVLLTAVISIALRKAPPQGQIRIELSSRNNQAILDVISDRLEDGEDGRTSVSMVVSQELTKAMGGTLQVDRPAEGGISLHLSLPIGTVASGGVATG
jgi:CheY-like chemotaxis protein